MTTHTTIARVRTTRRMDADAGVNLSKRRRWYADEPPEEAPTPDTPPETQGEDGADKPIMTTAQLKDRLERAKRAEREALLKDLGIEDPEADKELLASARKRREDEKTEAQKAEAARLKAEKERDDAKAEFAAYKAEQDAKARSSTRDTAINAALTEQNAKADKVLKLLKADHLDMVDAVLKDDGSVDKDKLNALIKKAREVFPEDFKPRGVGSPSNAGGRPVDPDKASKVQAAQEQRNFIKTRGW